MDLAQQLLDRALSYKSARNTTVEYVQGMKWLPSLVLASISIFHD